MALDHLHIASATTARCPASSGDGFGQFPGVPVDLHRLRVVLPDRWAAFLRAHFRDRVHVAYFFGVDERTARNWMDGICAPRAEVALAAVHLCPAALPFLLGEAA